MSDSNSEERHRLDMWLKHVCLFKHRTDATEACRGGHIKLNGARAKPAAKIREGDVIEFIQGENAKKVVVLVLPATQVSKEAAREMYRDESPVVEKIEAGKNVYRERGSGRPTKKERREIERFRS